MLVNETLFYADKADGTKLVSVSVPEGFTQVIFSAGAENNGEFVYGGYGNQAGNGFGTSPYSANGSTHGSDYLVDSVEFGFGHVEITGVPNHAETLSA